MLEGLACGACLAFGNDDVDDEHRDWDNVSQNSLEEKHVSLNALALKRLSPQKLHVDVVDYGGRTSTGINTSHKYSQHSIRRPTSSLFGPREIPLEIRCKMDPDENKRKHRPPKQSFNDSFDSFDSREVRSKHIRSRLRKPMGIVFEPIERGGVRICELPYSGAAAQEGKLQVWDELLSVNGRGMRRRTFDEVMAYFVNAEDDEEFDMLFKRRNCYSVDIGMMGDKYNANGSWDLY